METDAAKLIGAELSKRMRRGKVTIDDIMKATGKTRAAVYKWMQGAAVPRAGSLIAIARVLSCKPTELVAPIDKLARRRGRRTAGHG